MMGWAFSSNKENEDQNEAPEEDTFETVDLPTPSNLEIKKTQSAGEKKMKQESLKPDKYTKILLDNIHTKEAFEELEERVNAY